ncbi:unannotated protein [freshwater metagenome]|uniref:Unannotated protein n=1 Tax=freshwater metagenome TaxID=449393 RepID=A0A6J6GAU8_9ZZZZ
MVPASDAGGSIPFSEFVDRALYDPVAGFYATGGRAGGRGDFLTSPEVGPLFGAVISRALDEWWHELGDPDPFVLVEVGAGPGTLARSIRLAGPECAGVLLHVLVERAPGQRLLHEAHLAGWVGERSGEELQAFVLRGLVGTGPVFVSAPEPPESFDGIVFANELLDNLAFDIVRVRPGDDDGEGVVEALEVAIDEDGLCEFVVRALDRPGDTATRELAAKTDSGGTGSWFPLQAQAIGWIADMRSRIGDGRLVVIDYASTTKELAARPDFGWMRTFRGHERGSHPLDSPGSQDITVDVALDQIQMDVSANVVESQSDFLERFGIDELVDEGRRVWEANPHAPGLNEIRGRSRIREAEALLEGGGLGGFTVMQWIVAGKPDEADETGR